MSVKLSEKNLSFLLFFKEMNIVYQYLNILPRNESSFGFGFSHSTLPTNLNKSSVVLICCDNFEENFVFKLVSPSKFAVITYA